MQRRGGDEDRLEKGQRIARSKTPFPYHDQRAYAFGGAADGRGVEHHDDADPLRPGTYGSGCTRLAESWKAGFVMSVVLIAVSVLVGASWWKLLGCW